MNDFYVPQTQKGVFFNALAWILGGLVVAGIIAVTIWGIRTATAPASGRAGAYRLKNSTENRVFAQQTFEQEAADYDGYLAKIKTYSGKLTDTQRTELEGLRQICIQTAQNYNADARKYLLRDFKSFDLPPTLDASAC